MRTMRTIRERLIEAVANTIGGQVVFCDDDDLVHAVDLAAESNPAVLNWWTDRKENPAAVEQDLKAIRMQATEGGSRQND